MRFFQLPKAPSPQWTKSVQRRRCRPALQRLEDPLAPAPATADVPALFQDTVIDPPAVTGPLVADTQATVGPTLGPTAARSHAEVLGPLRGLSQVGGVAGTPGAANLGAGASSQASQVSGYVVQ